MAKSDLAGVEAKQLRTRKIQAFGKLAMVNSIQGHLSQQQRRPLLVYTHDHNRVHPPYRIKWTCHLTGCCRVHHVRLDARILQFDSEVDKLATANTSAIHSWRQILSTCEESVAARH